MSRWGLALSGAYAFITLAACSEFNMSTPCDQTAEGLLRTLAGLGYGDPADSVRLTAIASASGFVEMQSAYNSRRCKAIVESRSTGERAEIIYDIRQSEGLQNWYEIELVQPIAPQAQALTARISGDYRR